MTSQVNCFTSHFWRGVEAGYPLCCIIFYCFVYAQARQDKRMWINGEHHDWNMHQGYVLCPDCIVENLT